MIDFAAITAALQRMGLETVERNHHELRFEYPVLDLLDDDESDDDEPFPTLPYPENAGYRAKPASSRAHLADSGTDFFVHMPLRSPGSDGGFSPVQMLELFRTIEQLANVRGRSTLQIATSRGKHPVPWYHFRLLSSYEDGGEESYESTLNAHTFEQVKASCQSSVWVRLLSGLINRSSDRAYFHIHERLRTYRWYQAQVERQEMAMMWDHQELQQPTQLLARRLIHIRYDSIGLELQRRIRDLDVEEDVEDLFRLPCGHMQVINLGIIRSMTSWLCQNYRCQMCNAFVLQPADYLSLRFSEERQERGQMVEQETYWDQLAGSFSDGCKQMKVHGGNLAFAAQHALKSLEVPESVSPRILEFAGSQEANVIMKAIWVEVAKREVFEGTQDEIGSVLLGIRDKALAAMVGASEGASAAQILPPGWERMSQRWLMRAVQLASVPGYDGRNVRAVFDAAGERDEEEMERQATADEIESLLARASII